MKEIKILFALMLIFVMASCGKNKSPKVDLPDCIVEEINNDSLLRVLVQELNGELHYWLNTGSLAYDGPESIVDEQCNEVCYFGSWVNPECLEDYSSDWELVWPE